MTKYRIGLLVDYATSEYVQGLKNSILQFCIEHDMQLYIFPVRSIVKPAAKYDYQYRAALAHITPGNLDGLIIASGTQSNDMTKEDFLSLIATFGHIPIVSMGYDIPGIPSVTSDCRQGFGDLISHLIEKHGCRKIALLSVQGRSIEVEERTAVYRTVLEQHGIPVDESIILKSRFDYTAAHDTMAEYAASHDGIDFDAVVALNEDMAYGCIDFCRQNNLLVPDDIIVTGFDDLPRASFSVPTLTTVNQGLSEQGDIAARTLYDTILGKKVPDRQTMGTRAIFRQSCGCISMSNSTACAIDAENHTIPFEVLHNTQSIAEWFIKRDQIIKVTQFITDAQDEIDLSVLRRKLNDKLASFEIPFAVICLYQTPVQTESSGYFSMPGKAYVLCAFDSRNGTSYQCNESQPDIFDPRGCMIPQGFDSVLSKEKISVPLFHCKTQYGYIVYCPGSYDITVYEIMCRTLSSLISTAYSNTKAGEEKQKLTEKNRKLDYISRTDELTKILNRRGFLQLGQQTIDIAITMQQTGLIIYGDMDGLKKINDTYGHEAGDRAIKAEAMLLKASFRNTDIVGRLGGDEFAVVAAGLSEKEFAKIRKTLNDKCKDWNKKSHEPFKLSISLGCTGFDTGASDLTLLLKDADEKQYEEKRSKQAERK